jgi:uncharacterized protein YjiK
MWRALPIVCVLLGVSGGCAPQDAGPYDWAQHDSWALPDNLREISGLAFTADGRLFAHDDERAIIYQLDYVDGAVKKRFALGEPPEEDDFEAIATTATHVYLVTSEGRILEAREGGDGESVPFQSYEAGTEDACELEGAAYVPARGALALTCKRLRDGRGKYTQIHYWSITEHRVVETQDVTLRPATEQLGSDKFPISDITWDQTRNRFVAISSQERGLIELDRDGRVLYASRLPRGEHRQAEGIAIDRDGKLLIADEGGKARARLTTYPARQP